jgi:hypothetical protein
LRSVSVLALQDQWMHLVLEPLAKVASSLGQLLRL